MQGNSQGRKLIQGWEGRLILVISVPRGWSHKVIFFFLGRAFKLDKWPSTEVKRVAQNDPMKETNWFLVLLLGPSLWLIFVLRQSLMYPRLAWESSCREGWPETSNPPASASGTLRSQVFFTMQGLLGGRDLCQGFTQRQDLYQLHCTPMSTSYWLCAFILHCNLGEGTKASHPTVGLGSVYKPALLIVLHERVSP